MYGNTLKQYRMQIEWNEQTTEWFRRASVYTGFHRELADILMKRIPQARTVCDLGCGAGMIDFYLADRIEQVTCVDRIPEVINLLNSEIGTRAVKNMKAYCADIDQLDGL